MYYFTLIRFIFKPINRGFILCIRQIILIYEKLRVFSYWGISPFVRRFEQNRSYHD